MSQPPSGSRLRERRQDKVPRRVVRRALPMDRSDHPNPAVETQSDVHVARILPRPARRAGAEFERALVRYGRGEHEWLQTDREGLPEFEHCSARMVVLANRVLASTDDATIEVELVVLRGHAACTLDLLYRLPEGSWLTADDAWDWPLLDAVPEGRECRTRIELPDGRVRVNARLAAGGRLCARLVAAAE